MNDVSSLPFSRWLKRLRAQQDLTQEALAELAYCSVQTIRFFESGKRRPSLEMAERLAEVLAIPAEQRALFIRQARTSLSAAGDENGAENSPLQSLPSAEPTSVSVPTPPAARIPLPATVLVGRQPEATRLHHLLVEEGNRLVTLVGPGGIGKTRLALHMAHTLDECFANGAVFVPLVSISHSTELPSAIAGAMNATLAGDSSSTAQLDALLSGQSLLLVLDNFEHLLALDGDLITSLIDHILQHIPGVYLLITSRERLRLGGECIFELGGLLVPNTEETDAQQIDKVAASDAVILFLQRARQVSPSFALTPSNRKAIVRLCNLLSGMPLGIELAAAWMRALTPEEIATEIAHSLDFLTLADRGAPARHRSLRAAFEHSWKLLAPEEQKAAARLSIFRGGFRREGAQAVAGATLPRLAALIDKSLVQVLAETAQQEGGLRYEIHELLRQYLRDKLVEMGDAEEVARRHIDYFTAMAEKVESHHYATVPPAWFKQLRSEQGNLRAALEWSLGGRNATDLGLRLVGALGRYWYMGDAWHEGREWLRSALDVADSTTPPQVLAMVLTQLGDLEHAMAEYTVAQSHLEEALAIWRGLDDQPHIAWALFQMGVLASTVADFPKAEALFDESLALYRCLDEPWFVALVLMQLAGTRMQNDDFGRATQLLDEAVPIFRTQERSNIMAVAINLQGWAHLEQSNYAPALQHFNEALAIGQDEGNLQMMGWSLRNLGMAHLLSRQLEEARPYLCSCLRLYQKISFKSGMVVAFEGLAAVAAEQGEAREAVRWLAVVEALRRAIGMPRAASEERLYYNRTVELAQALLEPPAWDAAWKAGAALSLDEALAQAVT
ncbi:MAG: tetratricopeptide repeat protein [Caldilineaceae bacterium]|nr:tetratricopeptide repeat protein [Caldilineaceae bacterium]